MEHLKQCTLLISGELYTLIMIDAMAGLTGMGNYSHPYINWLQVNKKDAGDKGDTILRYTSPKSMSTYMIMVYKQAKRITAGIGWFVQKCDRYESYR